MGAQDVLTLRFVVQQLGLATLDMNNGDLLQARERLALVVLALDKVTYPHGLRLG